MVIVLQSFNADGLIPQIWVGVFGLIAALASFRGGWKATVLLPTVSAAPSTLDDQPVDTELSITEEISQETDSYISS